MVRLRGHGRNAGFSRTVVIGVAIAGLVPVTPASAAPLRWAAAAPGQNLSAEVVLNPDDGTLSLGVSRDGRTVLAPAPVGLRTQAADLTRGLTVVGATSRTVDEKYTMTTGKRLNRQSQMAEVRLAVAGSGGARMDLVVRVAADGVAYRYIAPGPVVVTGEASSYTLPPASAGWLLPYNSWYEKNRIHTTAVDAPAGSYGYPSLFQVSDDSFVLLTESDSDGRYSGARLRHSAGANTYDVLLEDAKVTSAGELSTPWRTAIIGSLATVTESTLVDDLAPPAKFTDTSWIKPGKVSWSWLSEHQSPRDFERQKAYVDFASRNGWPYTLADYGWSETWVPELIKYAQARNVGIILWYDWADLDTPAKQDSVLAQAKGWGAVGVKLDYMESDSQDRFKWYDSVLAKTAALKLMANFHGSTIPHGLARTWPHIMSMEAVRGAENDPPAGNNPVQTFTRNVVGSMDYTPVSLEVGTKEASVAHEAALPVAFESGWTHFADKPEAYERFPQVLRFLNQVPTTWDETRLVSGYPGDHAAIARRNGDRWFVGAIAAGDARTLKVPLQFLGEGEWLVEIVRDAPGADRKDVVREGNVLGPDSTLSVDVPRNGGFAALICRNAPGLKTCDR